MKPGTFLRRFLAVYNLVKKSINNFKSFTGGDITPLDICHSNISVRRPEIGEVFILKPRPFLDRDIILDAMAIFVLVTTQFLKHI